MVEHLEIIQQIMKKNIRDTNEPFSIEDYEVFQILINSTIGKFFEI